MPVRIIKVYRKELKMSNCGLNHDPAEAIVRSQWQSRSKNNLYLIYRWFVAIFTTLVVINSLGNIKSWYDFGIFCIYLTHWGIVLNMVTGILGAVLVTVWHFHSEYSEKVNRNAEMPFIFKVYWALHNTALIASFVITIIYWTILHNETMPVNLTNVLTHASNSAIMFLDILIVSYPLRLYHVIQPIAFGVSYGIFSYIYYLFDGVNLFGQLYIYHVLNWAYPKKAMVTVAGTLILAITVHMFLFWVYKLRVFIQRRLYTKSLILPTTNQSDQSGSRVSMVFGSYGISNESFKTSTDKVYP